MLKFEIIHREYFANTFNIIDAKIFVFQQTDNSKTPMTWFIALSKLSIFSLTIPMERNSLLVHHNNALFVISDKKKEEERKNYCALSIIRISIILPFIVTIK